MGHKPEFCVFVCNVFQVMCFEPFVLTTKSPLGIHLDCGESVRGFVTLWKFAFDKCENTRCPVWIMWCYIDPNGLLSCRVELWHVIDDQYDATPQMLDLGNNFFVFHFFRIRWGRNCTVDLHVPTTRDALDTFSFLLSNSDLDCKIINASNFQTDHRQVLHIFHSKL